MTGTKGRALHYKWEIDVFSHKGYDPKFIQANIHTAPTPEPGEKTAINIKKKCSLIMEIRKQLFHTYGVLKEGDKLLSSMMDKHFIQKIQ